VYVCVSRAHILTHRLSLHIYYTRTNTHIHRG
jgi:hypothetical protein